MAIKNPKKFCGIMVFVFTILAMNFVLSSAVSGLETGGYLHSNQYYSVMYDAEGDAIVAAKLVLYNTKKDYLKKITLELPSEQIVIYNLAQEAYGNNDVYYKESYPYYGSLYYPIEYEAEKTSSATLLTLHLPIAIEQQKQGTILIFYKIPRSAIADSIGVQKFDFKTIIDKNAALIQNVRVAVNVQNGLYLKGAKSEVEYKPEYFAQIQTMEIAKEGSSSQELTDFSNQITYSSGLVKNAYNLDPYESFHVRGEFSDSWFKLYFLEILLGIFVIIGIAFAVKKVLMKKCCVSIKGLKLFDKKEKSYIAIGTRSCIFGFLSAIFIVLIFFLFMFLFGLVNRGMSYYYGGLITPLILLLAIILMIAAVFGPAIVVGLRYGILESILTFVFICLWLFVFILVVFGFLMYVPRQETIIAMSGLK